ncbi:YfhE family protein [Salirhabdus sp. Marseille-P4669]|nr:YfhE family protein [Salirhabdus sp. Marseille-P4669]
MKKQKSYDTKRLNLSKTQQVLYQSEFKQADRVYQKSKGI